MRELRVGDTWLAVIIRLFFGDARQHRLLPLARQVLEADLIRLEIRPNGVSNIEGPADVSFRLVGLVNLSEGRLSNLRLALRVERFHLEATY